MRVLLNPEEFKAWAIENYFMPGLGMTKAEARRDGISWRRKKVEQTAWFAKHSPHAFPCVAYSKLVSYNYEESEPAYLYPSDLRGFLKTMGEGA